MTSLTKNLKIKTKKFFIADLKTCRVFRVFEQLSRHGVIVNRNRLQFFE